MQLEERTAHMRWGEIKEKLEQLKARDPQRGTLGLRAVAQVEEGLTYLASVGFQLEIAPRGTLAELVTAREAPPPTRTLSIAEGSETVSFPVSVPDNRFEAQQKDQAHAS